VVIGSDSNRMDDFIAYMMNPVSGLFSSNCVSDVDFPKIDYVVLINAADGHKIGTDFDFNIFSLGIMFAWFSLPISLCQQIR